VRARQLTRTATVVCVPGFAAIVLAGGAGRRLGGSAKPALPVAGRSLLDRVLHAVADATPLVVVGKVPAQLPAGVVATVEDPPGSGPVAATAAGFALLPRDAAEVAILAADLPFLTAPAIARLRQQLASSTVDGALYVDAGGRRQLLCGLWRTTSLGTALRHLSAERGLAGASMRALLAGLDVAEVAWTDPGPPPWFDCDTDEDLRQAEEWAR
jgi:molybdopterin-guanine dinucleotide biosynthesis protein A